MRQPELINKFTYSSVGFTLVQPVIAQTVPYVFNYIKVRKQRMVLIHYADTVFFRRKLCHISVPYEYRPRPYRDKTRYCLKQDCLTGSRGPHENKKTPLLAPPEPPSLSVRPLFVTIPELFLSLSV